MKCFAVLCIFIIYYILYLLTWTSKENILWCILIFLLSISTLHFCKFLMYEEQWINVLLIHYTVDFYMVLNSLFPRLETLMYFMALQTEAIPYFLILSVVFCCMCSYSISGFEMELPPLHAVFCSLHNRNLENIFYAAVCSASPLPIVLHIF